MRTHRNSHTENPEQKNVNPKDTHSKPNETGGHSATQLKQATTSISTYASAILNQSAEGAGGLGIIMSNKVGETE